MDMRDLAAEADDMRALAGYVEQRDAQCIGRRRVDGQAKTVRCDKTALPGKRYCWVCVHDDD